MASPVPLSAAAKIASYQIVPSDPSIEVAQATHRIDLVNAWSVIQPGARVLEIGCGQGNCTAVLAEAVGGGGHIDAVDPAPPDYGAPFTLEEAQDCISKSAVGERVRWHRAAPEDFLALRSSTAGAPGLAPGGWDVAVLTHCIWYFASPDVLGKILQALKGKVDKVCIAEYALGATEREAVPHVLAALARGTLEAHKRESRQNIQTLLSPEGIKEVAARAGWGLQREAVVVPGEGLLDGVWETGSVVGEAFQREIEQSVEDDRVKTVLKSARASVVAAVQAVGGVKRVRTMDVWAGVFAVGVDS